MSVFNDGDRHEIAAEFRRQEYQDREAEKEICGNCRYHKREAERCGEWSCDNEDSELYGYESAFSDYCECFERR